MARWKSCTSKTFEILPLSTCTLCLQKRYILNGIQPIFEILASPRRCWGWAFGWKVSGAQVFFFCNGKVKTLHIDNIWNFATFNLYTVPAKTLYPQRYSTDFRNLCFSSKMLRWAFVWKVSGAQVFYFCNGKVKSLHIENIWNFATFNLYTMPAKIAISSTVSNRFSKSLPHLEDVEGGHLGGKFQAPRYFSFAMARLKLWTSTTFEILPLSTCTLCKQKSCISKGIQPIFEIFASARRCWGWTFG